MATTNSLPDSQSWKDQVENPFWDYAARYWPIHFNEAVTRRPGEDDKDWKDLKCVEEILNDLRMLKRWLAKYPCLKGPPNSVEPIIKMRKLLPMIGIHGSPLANNVNIDYSGLQRISEPAGDISTPLALKR